MVNLNVTDKTLWGRDASKRQALVTEFVEKLGVVVTRKQVLAFLESTGRNIDDVTWLFNNRRFRAARGTYTLQPLIADGDTVATGSQSAHIS